MIRKILFLVPLLTLGGFSVSYAADSTTSLLPGINLGSSDPVDVSNTFKIILLITVLSIAPAILVLMTCFTRVIVVLGFVRNALGTQQTPPNQVLVGLALFLTLFIMGPTFEKVNHDALQPYMAGKITEETAYKKATDPMKEFMAKQTREKDLALFMDYEGKKIPKKIDNIPLRALVPAYSISELKTAFQMGFIIYIPFLIIDMIVSSVLMSMGMMMLPPVMISLPFKILLFILVDGWNLIIKSLLMSF
ncbi:flagellar type III secretion system pore protein FliP [Pullulanibacillus sp. KACC 23026]|uniref:flagellar type III secretion system pore protein FliP n=1 Tax=Pullulanibacillus sp. KACC 23026 TaxID=3028315 RepID=UPI0023AE791E|nr:flagellar type III secretion system pore protein FliP [Pullulanibacillus sp. KACC 23026]WEG11230.1 flagellar type III secretion system pore protein FliP [Pullulanibacillus sp. KACC 23026]